MITREDYITQSVFEYVRAQIFDVRDYPTDQVEIRESFVYELNNEVFDRNIICAGFDFDDEGEQAEMGSSLKTRRYTVEFWIFGLTDTYARNLANAVKFGLDAEGTIPLLDISQVPPVEIDKLVVDGVNVDRQIIVDPEPWQRFVWTTTLQVEDTYFAHLV